MAPLPGPQELASCTLRAQHPLTRTWVPDEIRLKYLSAGHDIDVELAVSTEIAAGRALRFAPHLRPDELLNRWVAVSDDLSAMLSIRFEGEDG